LFLSEMKLNNMLNNHCQEKLEILKTLYKFDSLHRFPSEDCQKVLEAKKYQSEDFTFELISYFSTIAGYSSWGKRALRWNYEQISAAEKLLEKSFFETFPKFAELGKIVTEKNTPKLYNQLLLHDLMRLTLLDVISEMKSLKQKQTELAN
jgi:hypothetical protein